MSTDKYAIRACGPGRVTKGRTHAVLLTLATIFAALCSAPIEAQQPFGKRSGDEVLAEYFALETERIEASCWDGLGTAEQWKARRTETRQELLEMLGLSPLPPRSKLKPTITGKAQRDGVVVERLHFQSQPGLYVTANLYRPEKPADDPLPAVLYVCGHGRVEKDGVSYGNKVHYQHHGAWFARHGYVCLVIDTIQLGELTGLHHGTHRYDMWWWNSYGYTPAGVEAWNCLRAIDYLESRDDVDPGRIGITGRSGGGAYSWWTAALDERVKVAVPVAGITSLRNHVVDDCVEGHCDCMFMVNTYGWDFAKVAALVAPRPLLISNTDKDRIFPLDGVVDVHSQVRRVYEHYDAGDRLGLHVTEGPHKDTQELRVHAFRWINRHLKHDESLISIPAEKLFTPEELKVFDVLPTEERTTSIHETFIEPTVSEVPENNQDALNQKLWVRDSLQQKTFGAWPTDNPPTVSHAELTRLATHDLGLGSIRTQAPFELPLISLTKHDTPSNTVEVQVLGEQEWQRLAEPLLSLEEGDEFPPELLSEFTADKTLLFAPRGIGPSKWTQDKREATHIRRRFMLLGQTLASAQVYDVVQLLSLHKKENLVVKATGDMACVALYATIVSEAGLVDGLQLVDLASTHRSAPDMLNTARIGELREVVWLTSLATPTELVIKEGTQWRELLSRAVSQPWCQIEVREH